MKVLLFDNYDSFTWNLQHYLCMAGLEVDTVRNDEAGSEIFAKENYAGVVFGPGPCTPATAGNLFEVLETAWNELPILGICLGHQAIAEKCGWILKQARLPVHGKARLIEHSGKGIFNNIANPMKVGRYHSLVVEEPSNSSELTVEAVCEGEIMAVKHKNLPVWGVQFHPESILTPQGQLLIDNWALGLSS